MKYSMGLLALAVGAANAAGVHVHGQSQLQVALDNDTAAVVWTTPANDLVGFEHTPKTDAQASQVQAALTRASQPLLDFSGACILTASSIENPFAEHGHEDEHNHDDEHGHDEHQASAEDAHTDFRIEQQYRCSTPPTEFAFTGFDGFYEVEKVRVEWVSANGAGQINLTADAPSTEIE